MALMLRHMNEGIVASVWGLDLDTRERDGVVASLAAAAGLDLELESCLSWTLDF